jgi:hypothetical protein
MMLVKPGRRKRKKKKEKKKHDLHYLMKLPQFFEAYILTSYLAFS